MAIIKKISVQSCLVLGLLFSISSTILNAQVSTRSFGDLSIDCSKVPPIVKIKKNNEILFSVDEIGENFLGKRYKTSPLGEGEDGEFDQDPLFRTDAFDCTTYIETVITLARCNDLEKGTFAYGLCVAKNMADIRYKNGEISFRSRNHFPELDWIPNNIAKGFFTDISAKIAGKAVKSLSAVIDKKNWYLSMKDKRFHKLGGGYTPQKASLPYVPLGFLLDVVPSRANTSDITHLKKDVVEKFPDIAVFNEVRENWQPEGLGTPILVAHQGFILKKDGELYMRHASLKEKKVIEEKLTDYMKKYMFGSQLRGFNILQIK